MIRKNNNFSSDNNCGNVSEIGVDINRNFEHEVNVPEKDNPCFEEYQGQNSFSENETLAIKNFVENHPNIKASLDYHSFGNLYILPSNLTTKTINKTPYNEFHKEAGIDRRHKLISSKNLTSHEIKGDLSTWLHNEKKIFSMTALIGSESSLVPINMTQAFKDIG